MFWIIFLVLMKVFKLIVTTINYLLTMALPIHFSSIFFIHISSNIVKIFIF